MTGHRNAFKVFNSHQVWVNLGKTPNERRICFYLEEEVIINKPAHNHTNAHVENRKKIRRFKNSVSIVPWYCKFLISCVISNLIHFVNTHLFVLDCYTTEVSINHDNNSSFQNYKRLCQNWTGNPRMFIQY